jgi:hypothetical protein
MTYRSIWADYEIKTHEITQVGGDWTWYWELWIKGVRVNGGLATSEFDARYKARAASYTAAAREYAYRPPAKFMSQDTVNCKRGLLD